jgi:hypothetical protein
MKQSVGDTNWLQSTWELIGNCLEFYKSLFAGAEPQKAAEGSASSTENASSSTPALPVKKDGSVSSSELLLKYLETSY